MMIKQIYLILWITVQRSCAMDLRTQQRMLEDPPTPPTRTRSFPRTIVLSATLGLPNKNKNNNQLSDSTYKKDKDVLNVQNENYGSQDSNFGLQNFEEPLKKSLTYGGKTENINFYTIKCSNKEPCSSIIPSQEKIILEEAPRERSLAEIREYINRHNLGRGFQYTGDAEKDSKSVVAKFIDSIDKEAENERNARKIGNYDDFYAKFWPGHEYKPKFPLDKQSSKAQVMKYTKFPSADREQSPQYYRDNYSSRPNRDTVRQKHYLDIPKPNFDDGIAWPYNVPNPSSYYAKPKPTEKPKRSDGVWNRFASSTVSQLDRFSGDWLKISSSNSNLGGNYFPNHNSGSHSSHHNNKKRPYYAHPPRPAGETHQTSVGLTVLGYDEEYNPHQHQPNLHKKWRPGTVYRI